MYMGTRPVLPVRAGRWLTWYEPSVAVLHVKAGSSGRYRLRLNYAFHYGMYRFYRKHYAQRRNVLMNAAVYLAIAGKLCISVARNAVLRRAVTVRGAVPMGARAGIRRRGASAQLDESTAAQPCFRENTVGVRPRGDVEQPGNARRLLDGASPCASG
jgi:hypothetical protein